MRLNRYAAIAEWDANDHLYGRSRKMYLTEASRRKSYLFNVLASVLPLAMETRYRLDNLIGRKRLAPKNGLYVKAVDI